MQTATCVVCQGTVNVLRQKLVSVQWVEASTGRLQTLHFHSDCYVKWYQQTAASTGRPEGARQGAGRPPPASPGGVETTGEAVQNAGPSPGAAPEAGSAPAGQPARSPGAPEGGSTGQPSADAGPSPKRPAPAGPEAHLTPDEMERLRQMRERRRGGKPADPPRAAESPNPPESGPAPGAPEPPDAT